MAAAGGARPTHSSLPSHARPPKVTVEWCFFKLPAESLGEIVPPRAADADRKPGDLI